MVVVTGEGMELRPCSSSVSKHVLIYYVSPDKDMNDLVVSYVCVPVDRLTSYETPPSEVDMNFELQQLPRHKGQYMSYNISCICTPATSVEGGERTSPGACLYSFGGLEKPTGYCPYEMLQDYVLKNVYQYDLHQLPKIGSILPRKDMIYGMSSPLVAQVGSDFIYVLGYGKTEFNDARKPAFQKYNFKENVWTPLGDDNFVDMINNCDCDERVRAHLNSIPHVVIGRTLHISIGNSSLTFNTDRNVWENCKLFENFWSEREQKSGFSPTNFYGRSVWDRAVDVAVKKRKMTELGGGAGGPPFGFCGRGVLWDGNILLGIHLAPKCVVVAFLLDDETGRVVRSQRLCLDNLVLDGFSVRYGARLLDLGRDGYFCLVHFLSDKNMKKYKESAYTFRVELYTFQISRLPKETAAVPDGNGDYDEDQFVECKFVHKEFVAKNCPDNIGRYSNAFCV